MTSPVCPPVLDKELGPRRFRHLEPVGHGIGVGKGVVSGHTALGAWDLMSFRSGTWKAKNEVMSTVPATKASAPVDWFLMILNSMPSR